MPVFSSSNIPALINFFAFLFISCFYVVYNLWKGTGWSQWQLGIIPLLFSVSSYLRLTGKSFFKRYYTIDATGVSWRQSLFPVVKISWDSINGIAVSNTSINFIEKNGRTKRFLLASINTFQLAELQKILQMHAHNNGINMEC